MLAVVLLTACTSEVDDVFDKTASERIEETLAADLAVLRSAANGWAMQYYPSATREYGGFTMLVSFGADGKARVSCDEFFDIDKVSESLYEVKQSMGPMLTFDTYNDIFHFFSNPANPMGLGDKGEGMAGDYEFFIEECSAEKVVLKGRKTGNKIVMTPIPEGEKWTDYLGKIKNVRDEAYVASYDVIVGSDVHYTITQRYRKFILANADGSQEELPFIYTTDGIKFYEPVSMAGQTVQEMKWNNTAAEYEGGNVKIKAQALPAGYARYADFAGDYVLVYGNNSQKAVTLEPEMFNESFIMKGYTYDIRVRYNSTSGTISIQPQNLDGSIYLCAWAYDSGGYLTNQADVAGMTGQMQNYQGRNIIIFEDNGTWNYPVDSFIGYDLSTGESVFSIVYLSGMIKL